MVAYSDTPVHLSSKIERLPMSFRKAFRDLGKVQKISQKSAFYSFYYVHKFSFVVE